MAAVEFLSNEGVADEFSRPVLRMVAASDAPANYLRGPLVTTRRAARARMKTRRRRSALAAVVVSGLVLLAWPGHAFGGTNGVGLSTDLASSSTLSSGMVYVVQPGDTLASIARVINPVDPARALGALVGELRSQVVITGEHVLIP